MVASGFYVGSIFFIVLISFACCRDLIHKSTVLMVFTLIAAAIVIFVIVFLGSSCFKRR